MHSDRRLLQRLQRGPVSGGALAAELGISRAAVWKRIEVLRAMGLQIKAGAGRGYTLESPTEWLNAEAITAALSAAASAELAQFEMAWSIPSTNTALLTAPLPDVGCRVLLAEKTGNGQLIACAHIAEDEGAGYFGMFAVSPQLQGGGIGKALLAEAERVVRDEWQLPQMRMRVIDLRDELIAFYQRRGYRRTGQYSPFPYGDARFGLPLRDDLRFETLEKSLK